MSCYTRCLAPLFPEILSHLLALVLLGFFRSVLSWVPPLRQTLDAGAVFLLISQVGSSLFSELWEVKAWYFGGTFLLVGLLYSWFVFEGECLQTRLAMTASTSRSSSLVLARRYLQLWTKSFRAMQALVWVNLASSCIFRIYERRQ